MTITRNVPRSNRAAVIAPTVNDDITLGYVVGSEWTDVTADVEYKCLDNSDGAAVWEIVSYFVDTVQGTITDISTTDTLILTFAFVPSEIIVRSSVRGVHDTTLEAGHTVGQAVVTITGVDAMTQNLNFLTVYDDNGAFGVTGGMNDTLRTINNTGGYDGVDYAQIKGVGTWDTSSKQLTLTFEVHNTLDANSILEVMATAYR